jgi:hypothetical protein
LEEPFDPLGRDDGEAVGLLPAGRDLGEELVGRHAADAVRPVSSRMRSFKRLATVRAAARPTRCR